MSESVYICRFSAGIDDLKVKEHGDYYKVLKAIVDGGNRFSAFEATANPTIAQTMGALQGVYFTIDRERSAYPWCHIILTEKGAAFLAKATGE